MVTIEQIRLLEKKVRGAVEHINLLKQENRSLKSKMEHYETRISELEKLIDSFKRDQNEIEKGILTALDELNKLEDELDTGTDHTSAAVGQEQESNNKNDHLLNEEGKTPAYGAGFSEDRGDYNSLEEASEEAEALSVTDFSKPEDSESDEAEQEESDPQEESRTGELDIF